MKKHNAGDRTVTEQRRKEVAKARRERRKARLAGLVLAKLRPLTLKLGQLEQQNRQLEVENRELKRQASPSPENTAAVLNDAVTAEAT